MPTGKRKARGAQQPTDAAPPPAAPEPAADDWRARFERSEAARQKLRDTLILLREKAVNTEALLRRHAETQAALDTERAARTKAEAAATRAKKTGDALQRRVGELESQVTGLQAQMAAVLHHLTTGGSGGGAGASLQMPAPSRPASDELAKLRATVERHDREIGVWNSVLKPYMDKKKPVAAGAGAGAAPQQQPAAPADPVRARAVEARRKAAAMPPKPSIPEFLGTKKGGGAGGSGGGAGAARAVPAAPQEERPKKRVRLSEPPASDEDEGPPSFIDIAVAALRAVSGADGSSPDDAAVAEAVRLLGPGSESYGQDAHRNSVISALACVVLECAAATPARHLATPSLSPSRWFGDAAEDTAKENSLPSFVGVWCSSQALERHALRWVLHCTAELSEASFQGKKRGKTAKNDATGLCDALARELAAGVLKDIASGRPTHTPTERCAAAAAAAAMWRLRGDAKTLQAFLIDLFLGARPGGEAEAIGPAAAAVEAWPEAVPVKGGALGAGVMEALQGGCAAGVAVGAPSEARAAARWLRRLGVARWDWSEEDLEDGDGGAQRPGGATGSRVAAAARRKLQKFAA